MKASVKIIKRKQSEESNELNTSKPEKSVELSTREMVSTVKSWIAELQQRKRDQASSFSQLPVIATASANQNT